MDELAPETVDVAAGCALTAGVALACKCVLAAATPEALVTLLAVFVVLLAALAVLLAVFALLLEVFAGLLAVFAVLPAVEGEAAAVAAVGWEVALTAVVTAFVMAFPNCAVEPD